MPAYDGRYEAELRPFIDAMRVKLMANAYKGKWEGLSMEGLFTMLTSEVQELHDAVLRGNLMEVQLEAADVANFALMVANVAMRGAATGRGSDDRQMSLFQPTPAPIAHETENGASRPPTGYTELPAGKQCKCVSLWYLDGAFYCCNGTAAPKPDQESNYVMQGTWTPHEGIQIKMWKHLDTGVVVYDDHPVARERKLRIAPWRVGLCDDRAAE